MITADAKRVLETALLCAHEPLSINTMKKLFMDGSEQIEVIGADTIKLMLEEVRQDWSEKGIMLVSLSTGWRFQSRDSTRRGVFALVKNVCRRNFFQNFESAQWRRKIFAAGKFVSVAVAGKFVPVFAAEKFVFGQKSRDCQRPRGQSKRRLRRTAGFFDARLQGF